jgi:hypothetical protein
MGRIVALAAVALAVVPQTLAAAEQVSISAQPVLVAWTVPTLFQGDVAGARANESVTLEERRCGSPSFTPLVRTDTDARGAWHVQWAAVVNASFRARARGEVSATVTVRVRPSITVRELARGRFLVHINAIKPFWRRKGVFERFDRRAQRWVRVKTFVFTDTGATTGTTVWSQARFRANVGRGTLVRATISTAEARPCYVAGVSNMLRTR